MLLPFVLWLQARVCGDSPLEQTLERQATGERSTKAVPSGKQTL